MKYLIGEIGFSLLIAFLIGLLVSWLINQFFRSRALSQNSNRYEGALQDREREISRLRSDLRSGRGGGAYRDTSRSGYVAGPGSAPDRGRPRRDASVSGIKRPPIKQSATRTSPAPATTTRTSTSRTAAPKATAPRPSSATSTTTTRRPAIGNPGKYSVAAKDIRGDSASLSVRTNKGDSNLKRALDDEAYSKIKALAALGERDRQLQYSYNHSKVTKTTKSDVNQYQKLLEQKNTQVDDLQRKVRDLLAAQSKSTAAASSASTVREKQLKSNYEIESYEKVRAFAGWGEAERKLSLVKPEAQAPGSAAKAI